MNVKFDFSGWATRNNLKCSDGRIIRKDAFKHNNGQTVPLVWNHDHNDPLNVLGHAILENRDEGVYAYCTLNDTEQGKNAKELIKHGDISALSIYANNLQQKGNDVLHGSIREVSLVLAGANPGAYIENVISHGDMIEDQATIYTGYELNVNDSEFEPDKIKHSDNKEETKMSDNEGKEEKTIKEVFDTLNEEQKTAVYAIIGSALEDAKGNENEGDEENMKHNVFENDERNEQNVIAHSEMMSIIADAKRYGSMRDSALAHGIDNIEYLFPDYNPMNNTPDFISRDMGWVKKVMASVHHTPFSRIKSIHANLTEDEARAKGYIKGKLKKTEVFTLLKRTTDPTTVYKRQKMDRDDVVDITDFEVISWLKGEMRLMLDEELARAILVGDGRLADSEDKIDEQKIRPVWTDADLYTVKASMTVTSDLASEKADTFIDTCVASRKNYKGSGNPVLYTTEDMLTACLLLKDSTGRRIYESEKSVALAARVSDIVTVPVMENLTRTDSEGKTRELLGLIVNLDDYNVGADKGGAVNMFDDFDIDYNQQKYLIETRCSGALTKPYSAIAIELVK